MLNRYVCCLWLLSLFVQSGYAQGQTNSPVTKRDTRLGYSSIHQSIRQTSTPVDDGFELLDIDTLFYVENKGLTRILVNLNDYHFKLVVDSIEVRQSDNAFPVPKYGEITVNIASYIRRGEENIIKIASQGPEGSSAELIVGDLLLPGRSVDYAIRNLKALPAVFELLQNYPNPYRDRTTIVYKIPEDYSNGVTVSLSLYDALGRRVRVLVDERRYPGTFAVEWDGTDSHDRKLAAGIYFCHMVAGEVRTTRRLVHAR